jgi:Ca-activated chloride channel homolog
MFELATPWALLLLPVPYIIWRLFPQITNHSTTALIIPFFEGLKKIYQNSTQGAKLPFGIWAIWCLTVVACTGPRFVGPTVPLTREGHHIMLALDISGSMAIDDMIVRNQRYSRLDVVTYAAESFVKQRPNDKIGLILFGSKAYLLTPLTHDKKHILSRLEDASVGLAGQATAIGDAIGLSIKHLKQTPSEGRVLILLTDGVNNAGMLSPQKATELAQQEKIKIYTIGLGSDAASFGPFAMMRPQVDLDEETLKKIAEITHGQYFRATDLDSLQRIYGLINQIETVKQTQADIRPQKELYPWPLAVAFFWFFLRLSFPRLRYL